NLGHTFLKSLGGTHLGTKLQSEKHLERGVGDQMLELFASLRTTILVVINQRVSVLNPDAVGTASHTAVGGRFGKTTISGRVGSRGAGGTFRGRSGAARGESLYRWKKVH